MQVRWMIALGAVLAVGMAAGYSVGAQNVPDPGAKTTLRVNQVMRVGDRVITAEQLIARVWDNESALPQEQRVLANSLAYLRDVTLLEIEAENHGLILTDEEIEAATERQVDRIKEEVRRIGRGALSYEEWLARQGMNRDDFEKYVRDRASIILLKRILVNHFEQTEPSAEASHILVRTLDRARDLHRRLRDADPRRLREVFEDLAVQHSQEPAAGVTKGRLPRLFRNDGTLVEEAAAAVWNLKDGDFSEPVKTDYGYHIFLRHRTLTPEQRGVAELRDSLLAEADVDDDRFNRWVRWVFNTRDYRIERRLPGYDCKPDEDIRTMD